LAGHGYLKHGSADAHALIDEQSRQIDALRGEIFAKAPGGQRAGKFRLPVIQFLAGVSVNGLIVAAVMLGVANYIAAHARPIAVMGSGRCQIDKVLRLLVDARELMPPARVRPADGDIGRDDLHACHPS
jgi:hypothetical protein